MENLKFWLSKYPWASYVLLLFLIQDLSFTFPHEENDVVATDEQVEKGIASQYPGDKDIESHPSVIFASGFENDFEGWSRFNTNVSEILEDPSVANSGEKLLQTTATRGVNTGGDVIYKLPETVDELYLRFYTKFHKETVIPHHFVKIRAYKPDPYWGNAGQRPNGDEAFWTGIEPSLKNTWQFYTYWHKMRSWQTYEGVPDTSRGPNPYYGNIFHPPDQEPFERDEWICVEARLKANTPGKLDGEKAFWIDGVKIGEWKTGSPSGTWRGARFVTAGPENLDPKPFEGFEFRSDGTVKISEISLQWYVTERFAERGDAEENIIYFDDVVLATEYIGPQEPFESE